MGQWDAEFQGAAQILKSLDRAGEAETEAELRENEKELAGVESDLERAYSSYESLATRLSAAEDRDAVNPGSQDETIKTLKTQMEVAKARVESLEGKKADISTYNRRTVADFSPEEQDAEIQKRLEANPGLSYEEIYKMFKGSARNVMYEALRDEREQARRLGISIPTLNEMKQKYSIKPSSRGNSIYGTR